MEKQITNREKEILHLIANEFTTKQIAHKLYISKYTAETHRKNLIEKMGVKNTAGLIRVGFQKGILVMLMIILVCKPDIYTQSNVEIEAQ